MVKILQKNYTDLLSSYMLQYRYFLNLVQLLQKQRVAINISTASEHTCQQYEATMPGNDWEAWWLHILIVYRCVPFQQSHSFKNVGSETRIHN